MLSVIATVGTWPSIALAIIKQFASQVKMKLISQLITSIFRVLQKLLSYFNGTIIATSFVSSVPVWPVIFCLILKKEL